jgi:Phospholipase_D-nuclease N-terminal
VAPSTRWEGRTGRSSPGGVNPGPERPVPVSGTVVAARYWWPDLGDNLGGMSGRGLRRRPRCGNGGRTAADDGRVVSAPSFHPGCGRVGGGVARPAASGCGAAVPASRFPPPRPAADYPRDSGRHATERPARPIGQGVSGVILRFGGIALVITLAIWLYCLLDAITTDESRVRHLPKVAWVLIVLLLFEVGALLWLIAGRPRRDRAAPPYRNSPNGRRGPARSPARRAPLPPDDDPEFLAALGRRQDEEQRRMLSRWEAELRRREEELRRRKRDGDGDDPDPEDPPRHDPP